MRTISEEQKQSIEDASNAGLLRDLNPAFIEKDIHVTEALAVIARSGCIVQEARRVGPGKQSVMPVKTRVIFAGGTCLSKAHGVIERMSEDIDLKIELDPVPDGHALPKTLASNKARLKALHNQVLTALQADGFELVDEPENPKVRAQREYCCMTLQYQRVFDGGVGTLRPHLKLEFVYQPIPCLSQPLSIGYLMDRFLNSKAEPLCSLDSVGIERTICEKIISLLRRCSEKWDGAVDELDPAIVRHIYDVHEILGRRQMNLEEMRSCFPAIVETDRADFGNRHPNFRTHPKKTLTQALERAQQDQELRQRYEERLRPLVYSQTSHDFDTSFAKFAEVAKLLIDCLADDPKVNAWDEQAPATNEPDPSKPLQE